MKSQHTDVNGLYVAVLRVEVAYISNPVHDIVKHLNPDGKWVLLIHCIYNRENEQNAEVIPQPSSTNDQLVSFNDR